MQPLIQAFNINTKVIRMADRWLGVVVSGDKLTLVDVEVTGDDPMVLQSDQTLTLQSGNRPEAYSVIAHQIADYCPRARHQTGSRQRERS